MITATYNSFTVYMPSEYCIEVDLKKIQPILWQAMQNQKNIVWLLDEIINTPIQMFRMQILKCRVCYRIAVQKHLCFSFSLRPIVLRSYLRKYLLVMNNYWQINLTPKIIKQLNECMRHTVWHAFTFYFQITVVTQYVIPADSINFHSFFFSSTHQKRWAFVFMLWGTVQCSNNSGTFHIEPVSVRE